MKLIMALVLFAVMSVANFAFAAESWKIVPNKEVCMVTDAFFGKTQIPVELSGKTYYGCCEGCKGTLSRDVSARMAIDPVSKKSVDKASAVIAANANGGVLYFENKASFEKFLKKKP